MCQFRVKGITKNSVIQIGNYYDLIKKIDSSLHIVYITDSNLANIYKTFLEGKNVIVIPPGEKNKSLTILEVIYEKLIQMGTDRKSLIIGFGGGVITDIAGFVASTYMRGVKFGFIPTSVLAAIDASIGGKNGVNHNMYKNMIGNFNQPNFVYVDPVFFKTLPEEEYINGLAEAIKHYLIADRESFDIFSKNYHHILNKEGDLLTEFLCKQIKIKVDLVNRDEKESGERKKLNFGHTFGHAIEKLSGIKHGFAVSIGMVIAAKISSKLGLLDEDDVKLITSVLTSIGLLINNDLLPLQILNVMRSDKKKNQDNIDFVALQSIGNAKIITMKISELNKLFLEIEKENY